MKLKIVSATFVAVVGLGLSLFSENSEAVVSLSLSEIESVATCESIGWWNNNGNCVSNEKGEYFCKSDSWHELTDCLQ